MAYPHQTRALAAVAFALLLFAGCNDKKTTAPEDNDHPVVPDFSLLDVNPNSATHDQNVSPRDYIGKISCWYFGHAG
jgi:hypothetical protein